MQISQDVDEISHSQTCKRKSTSQPTDDETVQLGDSPSGMAHIFLSLFSKVNTLNSGVTIPRDYFLISFKTWDAKIDPITLFTVGVDCEDTSIMPPPILC